VSERKIHFESLRHNALTRDEFDALCDVVEASVRAANVWAGWILPEGSPTRRLNEVLARFDFTVDTASATANAERSPQEPDPETGSGGVVCQP
jgi:hypothetical protein